MKTTARDNEESMTRLAWLPCLLLLACASNPQQPTDSGIPQGDGGASDSAADSVSPPADSSIDAGGDAALDPFVPHPPAGSTKCGFGAISAASSQQACTEPSMILDDSPLPDGGMGAMPRSCSALTIGSGEWQVWCTPTSAYVWLRMPVTNANVLQDCHGASLLMIDDGLYESGNGGGNGVPVLTYETNGTEIAGTPPNDPQIVIASTTVQTQPTQTSGSASIWIAGSLEDTCNGGGFGAPTVLAGADTTWKQ